MKTKPPNNAVKYLQFLAMVTFMITLVSCHTPKSLRSTNTNVHDSLLVDSDGNRYPLKVLPDGNLWMTVNLQLKIPGSYCYENKTANCEQYGRLYTWESAVQVCKLLGEGWRLPTNAEAQRLTRLYGGDGADSNLARKEAYKALLYTGTSGFNAVLGGGRAPDSVYARLDAHGFYWTATETDSATAGFLNFAKGSQALYVQSDGEKKRAFSVRCVKEVSGKK